MNTLIDFWRRLKAWMYPQETAPIPQQCAEEDEYMPATGVWFCTD